MADKRYNVIMPNKMHEELSDVAMTESMTVVELIRRFIKLGLLAYRLQNKSGSALIIEEDGVQTKIVLM
jgi:hypothetical protein